MLKSTLKYLDKYIDAQAESSAQTFAQTNPQTFSHTLVIPAYNESTAFIRQLAKQQFDEVTKLLIIVVINQPTTHQPTRLNQRLNDFIADLAPLPHVEFLAINIAAPPKQGVGLARKLGCDLALSLMMRRIIQKGWIHCTDADASLPHHYFTPVFNSAYSALVYEFTHQYQRGARGISRAQSEIEQATQCYERSLRYYRDGISEAGSQYAYTTIGSCMAVHPDYYAQARGFPLRSAGEDFYLLNKLNKLKPVISVGITLRLKPRVSQRVPFGTGPAVEKYLTAEVLQYDPQCFQSLGLWLSAVPHITTKMQHIAELHLPTEIQEALQNIGADALFGHINKQAKNQQQIERMCFEWFDAFKTLKFIHYLTEHHYPKCPAPYIHPC